MRKNLPLVVITLLAAATLCIAQTGATSKSKSKNAGGNSLDQMIINKSKETWEAYKSRNIAAIKALTAEDYVAYTLTGPSNLQQDIATIDKLTIESYTIDDPKVSMATKEDMPQALFRNYQDFKWDRILPDLGENSPEICILGVDPKTQATKLMIRAPKGIHVRKHWHSANETHTVILGTQVFACEGKRIEQGPGSFNYMPARMVHEAWLPAGSLVFITVDGAWDVNWVEGPPTAADLAK